MAEDYKAQHNVEDAAETIRSMDIVIKQMTMLRDQNTWAIWANPMVARADPQSLVVKNGQRMLSEAISESAEAIVLFMTRLGLVDPERLVSGLNMVRDALALAVADSIEKTRASEEKARAGMLQATAERLARQEAGALRA